MSTYKYFRVLDDSDPAALRPVGPWRSIKSYGVAVIDSSVVAVGWGTARRLARVADEEGAEFSALVK